MEISFIDKDSVAIIQPIADLNHFVKELARRCKEDLGKRNLIVDLVKRTEELQEFDLELFEELAIEQIEERSKSFVVVLPEADFNEFDQDLIVVRTLQEAMDLIEMDEIERDLI